MLKAMDIGPLLDIQALLVALSKRDPNTLAKTLTDINKALQKTPLTAALSERTLQEAVPALFEKPFSQPVNAVAIQAQLIPFKEAVEQIQGILNSLTNIPKTIDNAVAGVLETLEENIKTTITDALRRIA